MCKWHLQIDRMLPDWMLFNTKIEFIRLDAKLVESLQIERWDFFGGQRLFDCFFCKNH